MRTSIPITTVNDRLTAVTRSFLTVGLVAILLIIAVIPWFSIRLQPMGENAERKLRRPDPDEEE